MFCAPEMLERTRINFNPLPATINDLREVSTMKTKFWRTASFVSSIIAASIRLLWSAAPALADSPKVVQIEEQWELVVGEPDTGLSAPQATMVMSPTGNLDSTYFLFTLNCRNLSRLSAGRRASPALGRRLGRR